MRFKVEPMYNTKKAQTIEVDQSGNDPGSEAGFANRLGSMIRAHGPVTVRLINPFKPMPRNVGEWIDEANKPGHQQFAGDICGLCEGPCRYGRGDGDLP